MACVWNNTFAQAPCPMALANGDGAKLFYWNFAQKRCLRARATPRSQDVAEEKGQRMVKETGEHLENLNFEKSICKFFRRIVSLGKFMNDVVVTNWIFMNVFWLMVHHLCTVPLFVVRCPCVNATNYNQNHTRTHQSPMSLKFKFYVLVVVVTVLLFACARNVRAHKSGESSMRVISGFWSTIESFIVRHRVDGAE